MSASHTSTKNTKSTRNTAESSLVGRRFTLVPEVGLVDRDAHDHARLVQRLAGRVGEELVTFAERMREGLLAASVGIGLEVLGELMAAEVSELAGPRGKHDADREAYRHGEEDGAVVLGGRKVALRRPRVRSVDGAEVHLASYDSLTEVDLLTEHTVAAMLAGLSTRRYAAALEPVGVAVQAASSATSHSAASRRFVTATGQRLAAFRAADLSGQRWPHAVVSQNGVSVKVPLFGNPTLP